VDNENYNLCLVDTCILSDLFENETAYRNFIQFLILKKCFLGISIFTVNELQKSKNNFDRFKNDFKILPTFLVKPSEMILADEISYYPVENMPETISLNKLDLTDRFLEYLLNSEKYQKVISFLETTKPIVLQSILNLKKNYPPNKNGKYSNDQIQNFVARVISQQLQKTHSSWLINVTERNPLEIDKIKSLKSQLLITFWKFYLMQDRKPRLSDIFDIAFSSAFPYVDYVFTENNIVNDIIQIKRKGLFFNNLEPLNINSLINVSPYRVGSPTSRR
jgi:hypothetical protein